MKHQVETVLRRVEEALQLETTSVNILLKECSREKVQPPKDYWHRKFQLERQVKALKLLLETTK